MENPYGEYGRAMDERRAGEVHSQFLEQLNNELLEEEKTYQQTEDFAKEMSAAVNSIL